MHSTGRIERIAELAHKAANGGLDGAGHKATVGDLKSVLREIRDIALAELAIPDPLGEALNSGDGVYRP